MTKFRRENPLKGAPCPVKFLRIVYKTFRMVFGAISYYFMPFIAIVINIRFMVNIHENGGVNPLLDPAKIAAK